jgi:hypothetical protein
MLISSGPSCQRTKEGHALIGHLLNGAAPMTALAKEELECQLPRLGPSPALKDVIARLLAVLLLSNERVPRRGGGQKWLAKVVEEQVRLWNGYTLQ